jgi:hypothetical protein
LLRPGNAGSNTAADHGAVLDQALAQIPDHHRYGSPILVRCDSAGSSHEFLAHIRGLRHHGVHTQFSVGVAVTEPVRERSPRSPTGSPRWRPTRLRDRAQAAELTDRLDPAVLAAFFQRFSRRS